MKKISKLGLFSVLALGLCLAVTSCNKSPNQSATQQPGANQSTAQQSSDPAQANLAAGSQQDESQAPAQQPAPSSQQAQAPRQQREPASAYEGNDQTGYDEADADYGEPPVQAEQPPPPLPDRAPSALPGTVACGRRARRYAAAFPHRCDVCGWP